MKLNKTINIKALTLFLFCSVGFNLPAYANQLKIAAFEQMPLIYSENGETKGIAPELFNTVLAKQGSTAVYQFYPFSRALSTTKQQITDVIFPIVKTAERAQDLIYCDEVLLAQNLIFVVNKSSTIEFNGELKSLANYRFATLRGATYGADWEQAIQNKEITQIISLSSFEQSFFMLAKNRVDIIVGSELTLLAAISQLPDRHIYKIIRPDYEPVPTYVAFSKKPQNEQLKNQFDQSLREIKINGRYQQIIEEYLKQFE